MFIFILLALTVFFILPWTKQNIADYYGVCRKTLNKWIRYFTNINYRAWMKLKKVSGAQLHQVLTELGSPEEYGYLTKAELVERCETTYHTLRDMVTLNASKLGFDLNDYKSVDKFPPRISARLIAVMG